MKQQLSATTVAIILCVIAIALVGAALWMWRAPAAAPVAPTASNGANPAAPSEGRLTGRARAEEFRAMHMRGGR